MKRKQKWMALGLASAVGLSSLVPVGNQSVAVASSGFPFNEEAKAQYDTIVPLVVQAEKSKTEADVVAAYEAFILITDMLSIEDQVVYKEGNDLDKLYERLKKLMYSMPADFQKKHIPLMANKWVEEVRKSLQSITRYYLVDLMATNKNKAVQDELDLVNRKLDFYNTVRDPEVTLPDDWDKPLDELIKDYEDSLAKEETGAGDYAPPPGTGDSLAGDDGSNKQDSQPVVGAGVDYVKEGDTWYEVTYSFKNGKAVQTGKKKLSPTTHPHLYGRSVGTNNATGSTSIAGSYELKISKEKMDYLTEDQNVESEYTIQYSLDKQAESPYYFDTALRVDKNMNASYEQYKDVLYQIAVKSGGYVVEDNGRVLIVIDKKPIIVKDVKKAYSEKEIESLFEAFPNIDIRILKTRIGTSTSLEQQIVSKQAKSIKVDGKDVETASTPIVRDNRVLLPIKELSDALGAKIEQKEDKFVVTKGKDTVIYQLKSTKVVVKGKEMDIGIAPDVKDGTLYVEMNELAKAFGYILTWDADSSELAFTKQ